MNQQEIIQAKVIAIQSAGPGAPISIIKERFEFLVTDEFKEAFAQGRLAAAAEFAEPVLASTEDL